jgi:hypothetical protein
MQCSLELAQHVVLQPGLLGAHESAIEGIDLCDANLRGFALYVPLAQLLHMRYTEMAGTLPTCLSIHGGLSLPVLRCLWF